LQRNQQKTGDNGSRVDPQIKVLEEEIAYLNKHYEVEIALMKDEYNIL